MDLITGYATGITDFSQLSTLPIIIMAIIGYLIALFVNPLLLWLTTRIFNIPNNYKKSFITFLIFFIAGLIVGGILYLITYFAKIELSSVWRAIIWILLNGIFMFWLIKKRYDLESKKAFLIWLLWTIFSWILSWVIGLILFVGGTLIAVGMIVS